MPLSDEEGTSGTSLEEGDAAQVRLEGSLFICSGEVAMQRMGVSLSSTIPGMETR